MAVARTQVAQTLIVFEAAVAAAVAGPRFSTEFLGQRVSLPRTVAGVPVARVAARGATATLPDGPVVVSTRDGGACSLIVIPIELLWPTACVDMLRLRDAFEALHPTSVRAGRCALLFFCSAVPLFCLSFLCCC